MPSPRVPLPPALLPGLLVAASLGGCVAGLDAEQARICRTTIPAFNATGSEIAITRTEPAHRPGAVRIGYTATEPGGTPRAREVVCLFGASGLDPRKRELTGLATEEGPLTGAAFVLFKRFYLEDLRDPPRDPGRLSDAPVPDVPAPLARAVQPLLGALPAAATYALLASAYALIYGLIGRVVLGFGEFAALGSIAGVIGVATAFTLTLTTPALGVLAALLIATASAGLHGFVTARVAVSRLMRGTGQQVLIGSVGLAIALSEYLRLVQGTEMRWLPPVFNEPWPLMKAGDFVVTATPVSLASALAGLAAAAGLIAYLKRSGFGRAWRALSDDPKAAALCGVDGRGVLEWAFILGTALSGAAGIIVTVLYGGMGFAGGFALGLKALVAAVLGGIGSIAGACLGGIVIALFEALWSATMPIEARDIAVYALLALTLILRPGGFFGHGRLAPREI